LPLPGGVHDGQASPLPLPGGVHDGHVSSSPLPGGVHDGDASLLLLPLPLPFLPIIPLLIIPLLLLPFPLPGSDHKLRFLSGSPWLFRMSPDLSSALVSTGMAQSTTAKRA
jgi:hypothetical protein